MTKEGTVTTVKSKALAVVLAMIVAAASVVLAGCGSSSTTEEGTGGASINVVSREDGSGTRGAFVELFGVEAEDANGETVDNTTTSAAITNSTAVMMTTVAGDTDAIGYISLGSLNDTVKALEIDGAAATVENIENGSYGVSRPFNLITSGELSAPAQDFMNFIMSTEGQAVVSEEGYIAVEATGAYQPTGATGRVVVAGSSSVTPVMEKLAEAYNALNPNVEVEVNQSDSTTGVTSVLEGACDLGMASRDLKESEAAEGATATVIATDGIAVIVNNENAVSNLTTEQVRQIFTGEITSWSEIG